MPHSVRPGSTLHRADTISGRSPALPDPSAGRPRRLWWATLAVASLVAALIVSKVMLAHDAFPSTWRVRVGDLIADTADWFVASCSWLYKPVGGAVESAFELLLLWLQLIPAPVLSFGTVVVVLCVAGPRLAALTTLTILWVVAVGLWEQARETAALMVVAVVGACLIGIAVGIVSALNRPTRRVVTVVLDGMQAIPVFVYLLPVVLTFGPGNTAALLVTMIYAIPPTVRLTELGIRRVAPETVEAAQSLGATRRQLLAGVQLPLARSSIMAGINQTIMFAIAMSIIAAMIGAAGLGQPVWRSLSRLEFGQALEGGVALVLIAIIMDRASVRLGQRMEPAGHPDPRDDEDDRPRPSAVRSFAHSHWAPLFGALAVLAFAAVAGMIPSLRFAEFSEPPPALQLSLRDSVDRAVDWINVHAAFLLDPLKDGLVVYGLNPLTDALSWLPWPFVLLAVLIVGLYALGARGAVLAAAGVATIGLLGMWDAAVITVALVGTSVVIAVLVGIPLGIAMSASRTLESAMRPVLDVMQTLPIFLFVIPSVVILGAGSVAGVLATVLYAIAPVIRLTNLALREVDEGVVEASTSCGATWWQMLRTVRIPLGVPMIMAGVNQTIMLALAMAVVSAFIGSPGLGATILVALAEVDLAPGFEAGISMLVLAVLADRMLSGLIHRARSVEHLTEA